MRNDTLYRSKIDVLTAGVHALRLKQVAKCLLVNFIALVLLPPSAQGQATRPAAPTSAVAAKPDYSANYARLDNWFVHDSLTSYAIVNKAQDLLEGPLATDTENGFYWLYKGLLEAHFENFADADKYLEKAKKMLPANADVHYHNAKYLASRKGELRIALGEVAKALSLGNKGHYWGLRGQIASTIKSSKVTTQILYNAISYGDTSQGTVSALVRCAMKIGEPKPMLSLLEKIAKKRPNDIWLHEQLGLQYTLEMRFDKACASFDLASTKKKEQSRGEESGFTCEGLFGSTITDTLGWYLNLYKGFDAPYYFTTLLANAKRKYPDSARFYLFEAEWHAEEKEIDSAHLYYQKALDKPMANKLDIYQSMASNYLAQRYADSALKYADLCISMGDKGAYTYYISSMALFNLGNVKAAEKQLKKGMKLNPNPSIADLYLLEISFLIYRGKYKDALKKVDKMVELVPEAASVRLTKAVIDYKLGNKKEVCASVTKVKELDPETYVYNFLRRECVGK